MDTEERPCSQENSDFSDSDGDDMPLGIVAYPYGLSEEDQQRLGRHGVKEYIEQKAKMMKDEIDKFTNQ